MNRADLLFAFTKIYLWRQTQFSKIIYLDADVVALRAPEELFNTCEDFAAAPDVGWPDIFNTGVMVLTPNEGDFRALQNMAAVGDSFDGADQGLLNQYFEHKPWKRLSFAYNCTPSANYQYEPAYRYFKQNISLVHFIGNTKPWSHGRTSHTNAGAYQELASRWWAVYDRHLEVSPSEYIDGQTHRATAIVASSAQQRASQSLTQTSEIDATQTELPVTEEQEAYEVGEITSQPAQGSEFSAPSMDWDATRAPPPTTSRPEAANFPTQVYEFNTDVKAFHPPARYPDPPKNMWYEVPAEKPPVEHKPAPIFPWEERDVKPTRRFAEDEVNTAEPTTSSTDDSAYDIATDEFEVSNEQSTASVLSVPPVSDTETWRSFGSSGKNAWDEVSGIEDYVRALTSRQKNRGKVQVVSTDQPSAFPPQSSSPLKDLAVDHLAEDVKTRRESLILTDFPTAIERPSLPVTPAPRRRVIFWGEERDDEGNLPSAEGVPDQIDWVCPKCGFAMSRASPATTSPSPMSPFEPHAQNLILFRSNVLFSAISHDLD